MAFKFNPITGKLDIVALANGSAAGQIPFWNNSGSKWEHTEISELVWDDSNKRLGIGIDTPSDKIHLVGGGLLATGTTGGTPVSGSGTRLMWIPAKSAFRAGSVSGTEWDDANVGISSVVFGYRGTASGDFSTCFGRQGIVSGSMSTHFGYRGTVSLGYSTHFGYGGLVSGSYSTHFGRQGTVSGLMATHFGYLGMAAGDYSWVGGKYMQLSSSATCSFAWGYHTSVVSLTQPNTFYIFPGGTVGKVAIGTTSPATSAIMDITSTIGALLLPRMTTVQRDALTPVNGMLIYDTTLNQTQTYENGAWRQI